MGVNSHLFSMKKHNPLVQRWSIVLLLAGFVLGTFLPSFVFAAPKKQVSDYEGMLVISEFRTSGPDGGSDEFVEIFNRTNAPIDIGGFELQKQSSSGGTPSSRYTFPSGFVLAAGQYYLITGTSYSGGVVGDVENISFSTADDGGLALIDPSAPGTPVDSVGMTIGIDFLEGSPLPPLSGESNRSYQRADNGCMDTNNNNADFSLISPSDPQNSTDIPVRCLRVIDVTSTTSNGTYKENDPIAITVQFSSNVNVTGSPTLLLETGTTDHTASYSSGSGSNILTFNYTVQNGDVSADLDYVNTNSLSLNGGTIVGAVGDADLTLPEPGAANSLAANKDLVINNNLDPMIISFTRQTPLSERTNNDALVFRATFSEAVTNLDASDFVTTGTTANVASIDPFNGSVYDLTVSGGDLADLNGVVGLNLSGTQNIEDAVGKPLPFTEPSIDETYTVDNTDPTVTINQASGQVDPANGTPVKFTVVFSEEIDTSTFTVDDISESGTILGSLITWSIIDSGDHKEFTLSADRIAENGTLIPSIAATRIKDLAGNDNSASSSTDNTVSFDDNVRPTVTINQASGQSDPTSAFPIEFTVSFSEPIIASIFTTSDISQSGTATGISWSITNSGDDQHFTLFATSATGAGTLTPSISANKVQDIVGNDNLASTNMGDNTVTYQLPSNPTALTVLINEVAWSGTAANSSHEWIELYNPTNAQYDFSEGWKLVSTDLSINIELTGVIAAGGYYLLEDTTDDCVSVDADQIYSGSLSNTGEYLKLLAPNGSVVDTANKDGGYWNAGTASPNYGSMERRGILVDSTTAWITNTGVVRNGYDAENNEINGTPGQANWAFSVTPTVAPTRTKTPIPPTRTPTPYPFQSVVLNEVLPRPGHDWNEDGVVDVNDEFIEIINRGESSVSLNGWKLDDEANLGSSPYTLPNVNLEAGERIAIFAYTSHISLSDGGETVRLLKSNGQVSDVVTYTVVKAADHSWCRLPEHGFWNPNCFPTPNEENAGIGDFPAPAKEQIRATCLVPDTAPDNILLIECGLLGMSISNSRFWENDLPAYWLTGRSKSPTWFR